MIRPFRIEGRYNGQWMIKFKTPDGRYRMIVGGGTEKEAEQRLIAILTDIKRGTWIDPSEQRKEAALAKAEAQTWGDLLDTFKKSKYAKPEQKNSLSCLDYTIKFLDEGREGSGPLLPKDTPLSKITKRKMRAIYDAMVTFNLSVRTKNLRLTYMRIVFRWAVKHPAIPMDIDPTEGLERFKSTGSRSRNIIAKALEPDEVFTLEEVSKIIRYARNNMSDSNAALLETAFATGLRKGELVGLKWKDCDFDKNIICVRHNYDRKPKSGESRVVPMEPGLLSTLRQWKAKSPYSKENDFVFPRPDGDMRSEGTDWAGLVKQAAKGGIGETVGKGRNKKKVLRPELSRFGHLTRHTFATLYLRAGGSDVMLAKILGHVDTRLIHRVYAHFTAGDLQADMLRCGFTLRTQEKEPQEATVSMLPAAN